jgi:hypothetical protein
MNMNAMFDAMQSTLGAHIPQLLGAFLIWWSAGMSQTPSGPVYVGSWGGRYQLALVQRYRSSVGSRVCHVCCRFLVCLDLDLGGRVQHTGPRTAFGPILCIDGAIFEFAPRLVACLLAIIARGAVNKHSECHDPGRKAFFPRRDGAGQPRLGAGGILASHLAIHSGDFDCAAHGWPA